MPPSHFSLLTSHFPPSSGPSLTTVCRSAGKNSAAKYLGAARDDAALILSRDSGLATPRGLALRHLLYLFGKDEAIKLIRAG